MANKLFVVAKREYTERVRSRLFIVMTLLIPVLMAGALLIPTYLSLHGEASTAVRHIAIIDATGAGLGDQVTAALMADSSLSAAGSDSIKPRVITATAATVAKTVDTVTAEVQKPAHIVGYLVLDSSTVAGKSARYAGRNASNVTDMEKLQTVLRDQVMMMRLQNAGVGAAVVSDLAKTRLQLSSERLSERGRSGSGESGLFAGIIVGILLFMSITIHGQNIMRGVLEEKTTRVAEVVISSIKPETLLAGKVIGVGGVGLTQQIAWLGIGAYLVSFLTPLMMKGTHAAAAVGSTPSAAGALSSLSMGMLALTLVYFLVGFVFYASLYAAAGSMVNSEQEAQQAATPVLILLMSTWIMVQTVFIKPDGKIAVVLSWLPWSSPIVMPMRMGLTTVSPLTVAGSIVVALIGCVGGVWLSARIYRVGMLMYGKKPSFAEVAKWIRYA